MRLCLLFLLTGLFTAVLSDPAPLAGQTKEKAKAKAKGKDESGPIDPNGRPKGFEEGKGPRVALWYEEGTWHLRATGKQDHSYKFTGGVDVKDGVITTGATQGLEKGKHPDVVTTKQGRKGFTFAFTAKGTVDGLYFKTSEEATEINVHLMIDGDETPKFILIGAHGRHPDKAIFAFPAFPKKE